MSTDDGLDNPGVDPEKDAFGRWPFSERLADAIAAFDAQSGAPVLGLFGKWGYGKSTVLNYVKAKIATAYVEKIVLYDFNPWLFTNRDELLASFFAGLAARLEESLGNNKKTAGSLLQKYSGVFGMIPIVGTGASKFAEQVGKELSSNSLQEQRANVTKIMKSAEKTVLVIIDDIDRLDHEEIMALLKVVRLTANLPHVVYLLAFDDEAVAKIIGANSGLGFQSGRQFLEKIVQYPFTMPAVGGDRLSTFVVNCAKDACESAGVNLESSAWRDFQWFVSQDLRLRLTTPRQAVRFKNALRFALPILGRDVDTLDLLKVEALRILYPEVYTFMRDNAHSVMRLGNIGEPYHSIPGDKSGNEVIQEIAAQIAGGTNLTVAEQSQVVAGASIMWGLFHHDRPKSEKSIQYDKYFERYFSYSVPASEPSTESA
jgi:predicted KAP-like P-loop ATPase